MKDSEIKDKFYLQVQRAIDITEAKFKLFASVFYTIRILLILLAGTITIYSANRGLNPNLTPISNAVSVDSPESGLPESEVLWLQSINWILVLGALTTALTASDTLFQTEAKKGAYKLALFELRSIRSEYVHEYHDTEGKVDRKFIKDLFERYKKANSYGLNLGGADSDGGGAA